MVAGAWEESHLEAEGHSWPKAPGQGGTQGSRLPSLTVSWPLTSCQGLSLAEPKQRPEDKWVIDVAHG